MVHLPALASELRVQDVIVKDESHRLGMQSFKGLGVSYAVGHLIEQQSIAKNSVLVSATAGNHGRALAMVARKNGLAARIYVPIETVPARVEAIEKEGAEVIVVNGIFEDAVRKAADDADINSSTIISDTSWDGYESIPRLIMAGYTRLLDEAASQWRHESPPDVVLVQAGVGGLACAVVSWLCYRYGAQRPFVVVCEPASAACLLEAARARKLVLLPGPLHTIMTGLRCGQISPICLPTIQKTIDAFVAVEDEWCERAMRLLARPTKGDPLVVAGASGAGGLAVLLAILKDEVLRPVREASRLSTRSRVFIINTEGATDPSLYLRITGRTER